MKDSFFMAVAISVSISISISIGFIIGNNYQKKININSDLPNLNVQIAVIEGQLKAITERYNDYGYRIQHIEDRMRIFNHD